MTRDNFEVARRKYADKWQVDLDEPDQPPEDEPLVEMDLGDPSPSMMSRYYERHPEARPKPAPKREIRKLGQVAPGVDGSELLVKYLTELKALMENYRILAGKLDAFEQKRLDECTSKPDHVWLDGECVEVQPGILDPAPAPPTPAGMSKTFTKSLDCGNRGCKSYGRLHEHSPSGGIFGYELN